MITLILILCIFVVNAFKETNQNQYFILSTSKFWFNMRQSVNTLMIYQILKDNGIRDENILLLIPENTACNSKNNQPGIVCPYDNQIHPNIFRNVEVDYKQNDVSIQAWINIWRGKYSKYTPQSKRLKLNDQKRFITYTTGHGGDGYMKMQDTSYILDFEMAKVVKEMEYLKIYKEAFFISDSCSAITLYEQLNSTNTLALGSSSFDEKSYSNGKDSTLLISKTDRFSMANFDYFQNKRVNSKSTLADLMKLYDPSLMNCHAKLINNLQSQKSESQILLSDYFNPSSEVAHFQYLNNMVTKPQSGKELYKWKLMEKLQLSQQINEKLLSIEQLKAPLKQKAPSFIMSI